jgi:hypothetical protein
MVKKLFFTLVFLVVIGWVSAQSVQFEMDGRVFANNEVLICEDSINEMGEIELKMQLRNMTDKQINVIVAKEYVKIVDGTANYFCWGDCLSPIATQSRPIGMEANAVSGNGEPSFHYQLDPDFTGDVANYPVGTSIIKYYAYVADNPDDKVCLEVWFAYGASSIDENKISFSHAYPNPASSLVHFNYQLPATGNVSVSVYNLLGQEVLSQQLEALQGQAVLSVADLTEGIYFCNLKVDGRAVRTEKFVVEK